MRANHGNALAKLIVVLVIVAGAVGIASVRLRETAIVAEVRKGSAVDAVPGSIVVHADKDLQELKIEGSGRVVECERLDPGSSFKKGDVLLRLDTTEIERTMADAKRLYETNR